MSDQEQIVDNSHYEHDAREMGWVEKDKFRGPPERWVDAKEFVELGETFLPMVRAQNKRMKQELSTRDQEIATLKQSQADTQKALSALQKHYTEATKQQVALAKRELADQIKQAREDGNTDLEIQLLDQLSDVRQAEKEAQASAKDDANKEDKSGDQPKVDPRLVAWNKEHPWFGGNSREDQRRSTLLIRIGQDLRFDGDKTVGTEFMDKCLAILEERESGLSNNNANRRESSKVEGGNSRSTSGGGRAFDKLSKEAKQICHSDNDKFVGDGKMFKTVKDWEDHFASLVEEQG